MKDYVVLFLMSFGCLFGGICLVHVFAVGFRGLWDGLQTIPAGLLDPPYPAYLAVSVLLAIVLTALILKKK